MLHDKVWVCKDISVNEVERLSRELGVSKLVCRVLLNRGMKDIASIKRFLKPSLEDMHDPFLLKDMEKATDRICRAIENREKIVVYGDYDVDGVTSTSILCNFLARQGVDADYYIPDRIDEGYGLSIDAVDKVIEGKPDLIITVDCGVTAIDEVNHIKDRKVDIIITDHHECGDILPDAYAVINPCRSDCRYPFKGLAGVGVVFKLLNAVCIKMGLGDTYLEYLDLTALGTVADVVPLIDENRVIAKYGMQGIEKSNNIGLRTLVECTGLKDKAISAGTVGFVLAPRVNAAGRLGDASRGVKLFTTSDEKEALQIALELNEENKHRQDTQEEIYRQAVEAIEKEIDLNKDKVIVIAKEGWHPGVIGIVASKITEKYYRPCILISDENGIGKGSGRSIESFNLYKALNHCDSILTKYGGHELAAGLTIDLNRVDEFRKMINEYANSVLKKDDLVPQLKIDTYICKDDISFKTIQELKSLAPFGPGNPGPVFAYDRLKIREIRTVGSGKHLKMVIEDGTFCADAIGFNMGEYANLYSDRDFLDLAFSLEINTWNEVQKVQFNLKDIRPNQDIPTMSQCLYQLDKCIEFSDLNDYNSYNRVFESIKSAAGRDLTVEIDELVPDRLELAAVYKYIKAHTQKRFYIDNLFTFAKQIASVYKIGMNYFKVKKSIEIFEELELLRKEQSGRYGMVVEILESSKTSLERSALYKYLQNLKKHMKKACN